MILIYITFLEKSFQFITHLIVYIKKDLEDIYTDEKMVNNAIIINNYFNVNCTEL